MFGILRGGSCEPNTCKALMIFTPGASIGTMIIDCCLCLSALLSVFPMKIQTLHRGSIAPEKGDKDVFEMGVSFLDIYGKTIQKPTCKVKIYKLSQFLEFSKFHYQKVGIEWL